MTIWSARLPVVAITAGNDHSLALKSDGTVVAWGSNRFGEASMPSTLSGVTAIAAGGSHSLALQSGGFSLTENSAHGTAVGSVVATDPDAGQLLTYAIAAGNTGGAFAIHPTSGQITVANSGALNFETTPNSTLTVQIMDNGSPVLSASTTVGIRLLSPLKTWRQTHFGSTANSGNGADLADFDQDGLLNLIEYAFGLNPTMGSSRQLPQAQRSGGNFFYDFTAPAGVSGLTYGAEWSDSLEPGSWLPVPDTGIAPWHIFSVPVGEWPSARRQAARGRRRSRA